MADRLDEIRVLRQDAALALDELHHDGTGRAVHLGLEVVQVTCGCIVKALGEGEKIVMKARLAGGLERRDRAAVEGVPQGDDLAAALAVLVKAVFAGQLDRALVGLCARVRKEDLAHAGGGDQRLCGLHHGRGREQVGHVHELVDLLLDGVGQNRVIVA